jgi:transposase-like protein
VPGSAREKWRWPNGFVCPACDGREHHFVKTRGLYQCSECRHQASLTAGTIFASIKLPLKTWFRAMYHMTQAKQAISSLAAGSASLRPQPGSSSTSSPK